MKAKNREDYVSAWRDHIAQLIYVALDAEVPMSEYEETRQILVGWIEKAADNNHGPKAGDMTCTECGKPAEGNYGWKDGGELCDTCQAKDEEAA